jgi:hypothetical protein
VGGRGREKRRVRHVRCLIIIPYSFIHSYLFRHGFIHAHKILGYGFGFAYYLFSFVLLLSHSLRLRIYILLLLRLSVFICVGGAVLSVRMTEVLRSVKARNINVPNRECDSINDARCTGCACEVFLLSMEPCCVSVFR